MKTVKTLFAFVLGIFIYGGAMASGNLRVNLTVLNNDLTKVEISNLNVSNFEIDVKNDRGDLVFYKETKSATNNYIRNYDFSKLENGIYFFTVKIDNEETETQFKIENGKMNILKEKKMVAPVFIFDNNQFKLSYLNFDGENTTLTVYDSSRNELYKKDLKSDFVTQHGLDFSKVKKGSYEAVLSSGNELYSYNILVD
ncbi:hypothetical protein MASR2M47_33550 [Draconibacterium sp.]|jgi:hypothetical protein